ncbi:MAG TPA: hypothetical protein VGH19_07355 [Verrucomicrobiae bacterium]
MSLKAFHVVFVTASILLSLGFGGWALNGYFQEGGNLNLGLGVGAMVLAVGLGVYGRYFLKKLKHISYL